MENIAKEILELESIWEKIDSKQLILNVRQIAPQQYSVLVNDLSEITNSTKYTVEAWINSGRKNVKIPFLKLCMIADHYNVDIRQLLKQ